MTEQETFDDWWHNIGSGISPNKDEEACSHAKRVAQAAMIFGIITERYPHLNDYEFSKKVVKHAFEAVPLEQE